MAEHANLINPYRVGGALSDPDGKGFYGRDDIFAEVRRHLQDVAHRQPVLLVGQRRIGKSSILHQLPNHLPAEWSVVYFDLQGKESWTVDRVLLELATEIQIYLEDRGIELAEPRAAETTESTFAREFLPRVFAALDGDKKRLVLLFDEFESLDDPRAPQDVAANRLRYYLRGLMDKQPDVGFVFAVGRRIEDFSPTFRSAVFKDNISIPIGRLKRADAEQLIREPARGVLDYTDDAVERILDYTANHPLYTQVICFQIWFELTAAARGNLPVQVLPEQVDGVIDTAMERAEEAFKWWWNGLAKAAQQLWLSGVAELADEDTGVADGEVVRARLREEAVSLAGEEAQEAPHQLREWDVLDRVDGGYRYVVPLIGRWVRAKHPLAEMREAMQRINERANIFYQ